MPAGLITLKDIPPPAAVASDSQADLQLSRRDASQLTRLAHEPERPFFVDQLTKEIPFYAVRHSVKPGVTGWAQVRYHYGATVEDSAEKLQYDLYYVKNHSLFLDILVLFETVGVVLTGKGAQ